MIVVACGVAALFCLAPILAIDERRSTRTRPSDLPLREAFGVTLRNRPFLIDLVAQLSMIFGLNMVQPAMRYIATVLLGRSLAGLGRGGGDGTAAGGLQVVPHVLVSQLIDYDEAQAGASRAAMFYGMQGFLTKWIYGVSLWGLTFLLARFGNAPELPWGAVAVGPVAGACVLGGEAFGAARSEAPADLGPPPCAVTPDAAGPARIRTCTVLYERDGAPARGIVVGDTDAGERFVANTPEDASLLETLAAEECVGRRGRVVPGEGRLRFEPE